MSAIVPTAMPTLAVTRLCWLPTANGTFIAVDDPFREALGGDHVGALEEHGELVTAEPGEHVGGSDARAHASRGHPEQLVAFGVTVGVVHVLEVIEVDEEERGREQPVPIERRESLEELGAVREAGQRVVERAAFELAVRLRQFLVDLLAIGDVAVIAPTP